MEQQKEEVREVWIEGWEGQYGIDTDGIVWSYKKGYRHQMKPHGDNCGYLIACLSIKGNKISPKMHRLVAKAFLSNPENKKEVNHKDGNKHNNKCFNLEWVTKIENMRHCYDVLKRETTIKGLGSPKNKITIQLDLSGNFIAEFYSLTNAANVLKICQGNIQATIRGRRNHAGGFKWKYKEIESV